MENQMSSAWDGWVACSWSCVRLEWCAPRWQAVSFRLLSSVDPGKSPNPRGAVGDSGRASIRPPKIRRARGVAATGLRAVPEALHTKPEALKRFLRLPRGLAGLR